MFGKRIVELRKRQRLTQAELARSIGISRSALSLYEIEKREPDIETLNKLASLFMVPVGYILGNESEVIDYANYTMNAPEFGYEFKCRLQDILREKNISSKQFSEMTGFHPEDVDLYLFGNKIPSLEDLIKIAGSLDVSADYLLNISNRKSISEDEKKLRQLFNRCEDECKKYLLEKAGVLCVEGISAVAAGEYGRYADEEKKSRPSSGTGGIGA